MPQVNPPGPARPAAAQTATVIGATGRQINEYRNFAAAACGDGEASGAEEKGDHESHEWTRMNSRDDRG